MGRTKGSLSSVPKNMGILWMAVTDDKFELPLAVALTQKELAEMMNVNHTNISRRLRLTGKEKHGKMKFLVHKVHIGKLEFNKIIEFEKQ